MLSTLVTGGIVFGSLAIASEAEAPNLTKGETQIELPSSALIATIKTPEKLLNDFKSEGERLQKERIEREERLRIELEKARLAEEARLAKIEAERKAKEEAERKAREEAERKAREEAERQRQEELKRQAELKRQQEIARQQAQKQAQPRTASVSANAITMNASYYTASCTGCTGITATGVNVKNTIYYQGMRIIAVDPNVIPLYSIVEVSTPTENFRAIALDTGGAIKGNKLDILVANKQTAYKLGRHSVSVKIIRKGK